MKRVALIRNSYSYDFGGAELFPINLAKILNKNNYKTFLLSSNAKTLSAAQNAEVTAVRSPWWAMQNFSGLRMLLLPFYLLWLLYVTIWYMVFVVKNKIDVVHPQSRDDFISATVAGKLLRKKVIWTDHADLKHIYLNYGVWYKNPVGKLVYLLSKSVDAVTLISDSEKKLIELSIGKVLPANYEVTYIGVSDTFRVEKRSHSDIVFVSTSRLVKDKGVAELIEAFTQANCENALLRICGDGPDAEEFMMMAKGNDHITFLGHVDNIREILAKADVLVHPTYHEGFGLSLAEAEMYELAIIATNVGSIPEIIDNGKNGILVTPKDIPALAEAINKLAGDPNLIKSMGKNGREIYKNRFNLDTIVQDKYIPLYEN